MAESVPVDGEGRDGQGRGLMIGGWRTGPPGRIVVGLMMAGAAFGAGAGARVAVGAGRAAGAVGLGAGAGSRLVPLDDGVAAARPAAVGAGVARLAAPPRWVSAGRAAGTGVGDAFPANAG